MKEIKAYIHNHRIADVIRALKEYGQCNVDPAKGCRNLSVSEVRCLLKSHDSQERHYAVDLAEEVINESKLELICEDDQVDELMGIIERAARTGQPEAGWIYVMEVSSAVRIGEKGAARKPEVRPARAGPDFIRSRSVSGNSKNDSRKTRAACKEVCPNAMRRRA